ncbi:hypothetical protein ACFY64_31475 [Streptomyces collinus]|uniref:hypothetical protein n=1 Tax=Streptomyces collinus TaxID=42684 RepID=UPI0036CE6014
MNPELWERIARVLKAGPISNDAASKQLGCAKRSVAQVRSDLGLAPFIVQRPGGWTLADFEALSVPLRGGHRRWRGRCTTNGVPMAGKTMTAYRLSFRLHHDRPPVGRVSGTCRLNRCVAGAHLEDDVLRAAKTDWSALTELPAGATYQGMDLVAIRRCLRGPGPWPELKDLREKRFAFRFSNPEMSATELGRRLGLRAETIQRYRTKGVPPC